MPQKTVKAKKKKKKKSANFSEYKTNVQISAVFYRLPMNNVKKM